jgi:nucleoside-diphosphate-sugar epimerase
LLQNSILLTGASGFVGINLIEKLKGNFYVKKHKRNSPIIINENIVIHLAGKAHDLKNDSISTEYYKINTDLTKNIFDSFLNSNAKIFITISTVKAVADIVIGKLTEDHIPNPLTHYGKSKYLAEQYILSKSIPVGKRVFILRPCMIHGPKNKGNLNLLYKIVCKGLPWPLGAFENKRSYCSIDNLCFIIQELINNHDIPNGIYNVADDESISTNDLISLIAESKYRKPIIWNISKIFIQFLAIIGDKVKLPLNSERLQKLTQSYVVSNEKIKAVIGKPLPYTTREGLLKTFNTFNSND